MLLMKYFELELVDRVFEASPIRLFGTGEEEMLHPFCFLGIFLQVTEKFFLQYLSKRYIADSYENEGRLNTECSTRAS